MKTIIQAHNRRLLSQSNAAQSVNPKCNCRVKSRCPVQGNCQASNNKTASTAGAPTIYETLCHCSVLLPMGNRPQLCTRHRMGDNTHGPDIYTRTRPLPDLFTRRGTDQHAGWKPGCIKQKAGNRIDLPQKGKIKLANV